MSIKLASQQGILSTQHPKHLTVVQNMGPAVIRTPSLVASATYTIASAGLVGIYTFAATGSLVVASGGLADILVVGGGGGGAQGDNSTVAGGGGGASNGTGGAAGLGGGGAGGGSEGANGTANTGGGAGNGMVGGSGIVIIRYRKLTSASFELINVGNNIKINIELLNKNLSGSVFSSDYIKTVLDAVSDVKNFIEEIFNSIVGDNIPTFELEAENKAFHHLYDTFVELLNEATNGVSEEDFDFVMNDTMQKIRGDLDLTYNQIKIALSSIPYNIFLMAELPA